MSAVATPPHAASTGPAPAHVTWISDLAQSPTRVHQKAAATAGGGAVLLTAAAAGIWLYDLARLVGS